MDVQKVRDARTKGVSVFAKFCQQKEHHQDCIFCFFEGEDIKYYRSRIEQYTFYPYNKIIHYYCGGKKEVMKAYQLIFDKKEYDGVNKMFFIDRDYLPLEHPLEDVYQTPGYSIENFYTSSTCFSRILTKEFGLNTIDCDYQKCMDDFLKRQKEFHHETLFFNTWLSYQRKLEEKNHEQRVMLSGFKIAKWFSSLSIDLVKVKNTINLEFLKQHFPNSYEIDQNLFDLEYQFFYHQDCQILFRGKFELDFVSKILDSLKAKNREGNYFSSHLPGIHIDPNGNTLSILSEFADTPLDLIEFLGKHKA